MATLWKSYAFTVVLGSAGESTVDMLTYDPVLSRVRVDESVAATVEGSPVPDGATRVVERSTDLVRWETVRGGTEREVSADAPRLDDAEFTANAENHYRIRVYVEGELFHTFRDQITVVVDKVWLKNPRLLFLNRTVTVVDYGDVEQTSRVGVFAVVGRNVPVAVTDALGSDKFELKLLTDGLAAEAELKRTLSPGDVVLIHGPAGSPVPSGYFAVGDVTRTRVGRLSTKRVFTLQLTEVAAPSAAPKASTITWRGLANRYATWQDVLNAHTQYRQLLELVGTPEDVEVR